MNFKVLRCSCVESPLASSSDCMDSWFEAFAADSSVVDLESAARLATASDIIVSYPACASLMSKSIIAITPLPVSVLLE